VRKRRTLDRRAAVLRELDESGLSMAEFCRQRKLAYGTVAGWRKKLRRQRTSFVEVEIANDNGSSPLSSAARPRDRALCAELFLPGGTVLRVFGQHPGEVAQEDRV
jgi:hypothetical protein